MVTNPICLHKLRSLHPDFLGPQEPAVANMFASSNTLMQVLVMRYNLPLEVYQVEFLRQSFARLTISTKRNYPFHTNSICQILTTYFQVLHCLRLQSLKSLALFYIQIPVFVLSRLMSEIRILHSVILFLPSVPFARLELNLIM